MLLASLLIFSTIDYDSDVLLNFLPGILLYQEINDCDSKIPLMSNQDSKQRLDPFFVTGFVDAEGCFMIRLIKSKTNKIGWQVRPIFKIVLHSKDLHLLEHIQFFLEGLGL